MIILKYIHILCAHVRRTYVRMYIPFDIRIMLFEKSAQPQHATCNMQHDTITCSTIATATALCLHLVAVSRLFLVSCCMLPCHMLRTVIGAHRRSGSMAASTRRADAFRFWFFFVLGARGAVLSDCYRLWLAPIYTRNSNSPQECDLECATTSYQSTRLTEPCALTIRERVAVTDRLNPEQPNATPTSPNA